jgi:hypothetical protein
MAKRNIVIIAAGTTRSQGYNSIAFTPSSINEPQDDMGAETPNPKNDKKLSDMIKLGNDNVE